MTLELTPSTSPYQYRISATDKRLIERRLNKAGARWLFYKICDSPNDAKRALLKLRASDEQEQQP